MSRTRKCVLKMVGIVVLVIIPTVYANSGLLTDSRDNKTYKTVTIGSQVWMAENLNFKPSTGNSWCYETASKQTKPSDDNDESNCDKYGRLYDWKTAMAGAASSSSNPSGVQGVCPAGWHLPSGAEWDVLMTAVGGAATAGTKLRSRAGWYNNINGTDNYGFSGLPGGYRWSGGGFFNASYYGIWWTATEHDGSNAWNRDMIFSRDIVYPRWSLKDYRFSLRCLSD